MDIQVADVVAKLEQTPRFLPRRRPTTSGSGNHSLLWGANQPNIFHILKGRTPT